MGLWVVAAATGAGYVVKYWKKFSEEKVSSMESSSMLSNNIQSEQCKVLDIMPDTVYPLTKLARRWFLDGDGSSDKEKGKSGKNLQDQTELPVSGVPPNFTQKREFQENIDGINGKSECYDKSSYYLHELRTKKTNSNYFSSRRLLLATSRGRQLISGPDNNMKIFFDCMTDCKKLRETAIFSGEKDALFEPVGSAKLPAKPKHTYDNKLSATRESDQREVENLSKLLEHAEDLVQELHKELEMKDSFTVKAIELASDISLTPAVPGTVASSSRAELDEYIEYEIKNIDNPKAENFESRGDIEAELEAELERLAGNMRSIVQSISDVLEIDSDHEADITRGELKLDTVNRQLDTPSNSDHNDKNGKIYDPNLTPDCAVASLDLSLRLHEVIESRLRARIKELEAVLQNSQSKPSPMESQLLELF